MVWRTLFSWISDTLLCKLTFGPFPEPSMVRLMSDLWSCVEIPTTIPLRTWLSDTSNEAIPLESGYNDPRTLWALLWNVRCQNPNSGMLLDFYCEMPHLVVEPLKVYIVAQLWALFVRPMLAGRNSTNMVFHSHGLEATSRGKDPQNISSMAREWPVLRWTTVWLLEHLNSLSVLFQYPRHP